MVDLTENYELTFDSDGATRTFKTAEQLADWAEEERDAWQSFVETVNDACPQYRNFLSWGEQTSRISDIASRAREVTTATDQNQRSQIENDLWTRFNQMLQRPLVYSRSARGKFLLDRVDEDPEESAWMLAAWNPFVANGSNIFGQANTEGGRLAIAAMHNGAAAAYAFDAGLKPRRADSERRLLAKIRGEAEELMDWLETEQSSHQDQFDALKNQFAGLRDTVTRKSKTMFKWNTRRVDRIRRRYRQELALQSPTSYWADKAKRHGRWARIWGSVFTLLVVIFVAVGAVFANDIAAAVKAMAAGQGVIPVGAIFVFGTPLFFAIWLLRIVSRQLLQNVALRNDGEERVEMAKTYLSLLDQGKADREDQILILHSLFRPSAPSGSDDASPPHWFDLLMDRIKPAKK